MVPMSTSKRGSSDSTADSNAANRAANRAASRKGQRPPQGRPRAYALIRGRVESAVFTCPNAKCRTVLSFRSRTTFRIRCPLCRVVLYIGVHVSVAAGPSRIVGRPVDSILPPGSAAAIAAEPAPEPPVPVTSTPVTSTPVTSDPLPIVELGTWQSGTPLHKLDGVPVEEIDEDELRAEL